MPSSVEMGRGGSALEIEDCLALLLKNAKKQGEIKVPTEKAYSMVAAQDIFSPMNVPPFPKSAMDGYAVRSGEIENATKETPVKLKVIAELFAGDYFESPVASVGEPVEPLEAPDTSVTELSTRVGELVEPSRSFERALEVPEKSAIRVMTGSHIPQPFDSVVRQEDTDYGEEVVSIFSSTKPFQNYCKVGEDIKQGDLLVKKGTRLGPLHLGLLSGAGVSEISVVKPLEVSIICTGSELQPLGTALKNGKIYNNISVILKTAIEKEGFSVTFNEICVDEEKELSEKIQAALKVSDFLITTGGVSVGKKDIVPDVLKSLGAEILFTKANIQPGTPTTASVSIDGKIVLSLSGNPYAAIANFEYYFWSVAASVMQNDAFSVKCEEAELASDYPKTNVHRRMIRARAEGGKVYLPSIVHASSVIANLTECNCFIDLEENRSVKIGDKVKIRYFKGI